MLRSAALVKSVCQPCTISMAYMIPMMVLITVLIGCSGEGAGDPIISTLSVPADSMTSPSLDIAARDSDAYQAVQPPRISLSTETPTDFTSDLTPGPLSTDGPPLDSDSSDDAMITVTSTPTGATVRLNWQHSADADNFGYYVYYGKQPAEEAGSCAGYEAHQAVDAPPATIAGLEPDTIYYFAVKHLNDSDDACSEEIMVATPPAHS